MLPSSHPAHRTGQACFRHPALGERGHDVAHGRLLVRFATLYTRRFSNLVASTAALIATGWSEPVPGRVYPRCGPPPFHGAPDEQDLSRVTRWLL
jgi:hypothetical protein